MNINTVLLEHSMPFIYTLSMAACPQQSEVVTTEAVTASNSYNTC